MDTNFSKSTVYLIDDDIAVLKSVSRAIEQYKLLVKTYSTAEMFLENYNGEQGCLVLDLNLPIMNGLELQSELARVNYRIPIIFITGHGSVPVSVKALRQGAIDFLQKPFRIGRLLERIREAIDWDAENRTRSIEESSLRSRISTLTERECVIFNLLVDSKEPPSSKVIARTLDISHRTVEHHRSRILHKMDVRTVVELRWTVSEKRMWSKRRRDVSRENSQLIST